MRPVLAGLAFALVQIAVQRLDEDVADQRALAAAADAGDADERAERNLDVDVLEVVVRRAEDARGSCRCRLRRRCCRESRSAARRERYCAGQAARLLADVAGRSLHDHFAAAHAGAGAEVDDLIGGPHRLFVVLDDDDRVAHVAQPAERPQAGGRCRAGAGRSTARRGYTARRPGRCRSGRPGESAATRRPRASAPCGRASDIPAPHRPETPAACEFP